MYEPNQFVMNCGITDTNAGPIRYYSPLARNLNDGDAIYLVVLPTNVTTDLPSLALPLCNLSPLISIQIFSLLTLAG